MEKENNNNFMLKFSRIFSSSCITQDISKVIDHQKPVFTSKTPLMEEVEPEEEEEDENLFSYPVTIRPNKQTPLLTCKPRCPESFDQMVRESCLITRRKVAGRYSLLSPAGEFSGRRCPPVSPASPLFQRETKKKPKKKKKKKKKQRSKNGGFGSKLEKTHFKNHNPFSFSSSNETDWFSSDDEREEDEEQQHETEETLFPSSNKSVSLSSKSISLSSDSETRVRNRVRNRRRRANSGPGPSRVRSKREEMEVVPLQGKVKDTFAVVKSSSDPYNDFRTSMVEMIIEKQIFGERELEQLLQCFLSLNSSHHHRVIMEVFTEIWDALFSYCS